MGFASSLFGAAQSGNISQIAGVELLLKLF